ncbi:MAG: phosphoglycolate phosphatase [Alphaproteobacteria bacterium]|nr:phosphoglycolate phosphatase [Alphaproteobacteria bacterium]
MTNAICAILLDLDGTLVDSAPELTRAVNGALETRGRRTLEENEVRDMIGNGLPVLTERALAATGKVPPESELASIIAEVRRIYDTQPPPRIFPGVAETLRHWHAAGLSLVVCTNKPEASARRLMAALGLDRFISVIAGGDTYPRRKPHPDHLLKPLADLGLSRDTAVMVGDSQIDADAARSAAIPFIAVSYGYRRGPVDGLGAACVVDRFAEVDAAIAQFARDRALAFPPSGSAV